jgi:hypothetical protein
MIREYTEQDLPQMYDLLFSHRKITGTLIEDLVQKPTMEEFAKRFTSHVKTLLYFKDNELVSFISSRRLEEFPSWYISIITSKPQRKFNVTDSGFTELFSHTLEYWENQGLNSFFLAQPKTHSFLLNVLVGDLVPKVNDYLVPAFVVEVVPKGTRSNNSVVDKLLKHNTFNEDMVVKWVHKKVTL